VAVKNNRLVNLRNTGNNKFEGRLVMSYVSEKIRFQFETLPPELKNYILEKGVVLNSMEDLMKVLEEVIQENDE
jgi:actin-like ATPase involved in cell morphogenesis